MYEEEIHFGNPTFDPYIDMIPLLPRMDVWTKFEEGRSKLSQVIDRKRFWHI